MMNSTPLYSLCIVALTAAACTNNRHGHIQETTVHRNPVRSESIGLAKDTELLLSKRSDPGKDWLESLFQCHGSETGPYCYYLDQEDSICTARFKAFLEDANAIYGPSNLSEAELAVAESAYKAKWKSIYPLLTQEVWLFGRGNDDAISIKDLVISKISSDRYMVNIDYGEGIKTRNEVQLVFVNGRFKIDYCRTTFTES
ncbi:hypothetical protein [Sphingobacterium thalpophilum]|uniref:hypothetical protein n=1 Tax=Sphingobacterium thalpophilum TaxID=259 RepID=UPI0024A6F5BD|nr:hypothetical protein [Sphingobacterium thalpophilum]